MFAQYVNLIQFSAYNIMAAEAPPTPPPTGGYDLPECKNDVWNAVKPVFDLIISELRGFAGPAAIGLIVILGLSLVVAAVVPKARQAILAALGWVLIAAIGVGVLIGLAATFVKIAC